MPDILLPDSAGGDHAHIGAYEALDPEYLTVGEEVWQRRHLGTNSMATVSQELRLSYFTARKTETVTQVRMYLGAVAAGATPTISRIGIWTTDAAGALLSLVASTTNDTALLTGTINSPVTKALAASFNKVAGVRYAAGLLVVSATTMPQVYAGLGGMHASEAAMAPRLFARVTGQADLPASVVAGSLLTASQAPYMVLLP